MSGAGERLARLLALVPWLIAHPGTPLAEVARVFRVSEERLRDDLMLVFVCGLPGHGPGDLIDVAIDTEGVTVSNADTISRPLRLTRDEALALIVALRTLAEAALTDGDAVQRALAKVEAAAGDAAQAAARVQVAVEPERQVLDVVERALAGRRRLHLQYYVPGRDESTTRDVDPLRLVLADGRHYLEAWCHQAEGMRLFRLDRVLGASLLDEPARVPAEARARDLAEGVYQPGPQARTVTLSLAPSARWVAEYYRCESVEPAEQGRVLVRLAVADPAWVARLVLGLGGRATVVDPPDVGERVREEAARALAAYVE